MQSLTSTCIDLSKILFIYLYRPDEFIELVADNEVSKHSTMLNKFVEDEI